MFAWRGPARRPPSTPISAASCRSSSCSAAKLAPVELLNSEACEIIEANAETILEEIGIEFRRDPESLRLWRGAGADVTGERVHIPRGLARHLLKTAPREFTLYARNPARNVRFGGDATVFSPVGGPPLQLP